MRSASKLGPAQATATDPVTGTIYPVSHDIFSVGAGYLDIATALADTAVTTLSETSPSVKRAAPTSSGERRSPPRPRAIF